MRVRRIFAGSRGRAVLLAALAILALTAGPALATAFVGLGSPPGHTIARPAGASLRLHSEDNQGDDEASDGADESEAAEPEDVEVEADGDEADELGEPDEADGDEADEIDVDETQDEAGDAAEDTEDEDAEDVELRDDDASGSDVTPGATDGEREHDGDDD